MRWGRFIASPFPFGLLATYAPRKAYGLDRWKHVDNGWKCRKPNSVGCLIVDTPISRGGGGRSPKSREPTVPFLHIVLCSISLDLMIFPFLNRNGGQQGKTCRFEQFFIHQRGRDSLSRRFTPHSTPYHAESRPTLILITPSHALL